MSNGELREVPKPPSMEKGPGSEPMPEQPPAPPSASPEKAAARQASPTEAAPVAKAAGVPVPTKDQELQMVERVLEKGLLNTYLEMPPAERERFKTAGEQTATQLRALFEKKGVRPRQIHDPIVTWLKTIPKVNHYYLDQAAKIKTDGVLRAYLEKQANTL